MTAQRRGVTSPRTLTGQSFHGEVALDAYSRMLGKGIMQSRRSSDFFEVECYDAEQHDVDASVAVPSLDENEISSEIFVLDDTDPSLAALEILKVSKGEQLDGALRSLHQALSALEKTSAGRRSNK
jgi:hypothetical protein